MFSKCQSAHTQFGNIKMFFQNCWRPMKKIFLRQRLGLLIVFLFFFWLEIIFDLTNSETTLNGKRNPLGNEFFENRSYEVVLWGKN